MSFKELISHPDILKAIEEFGYKTPTPVQQKTIAHALEGKNLQVCAETGTGKTAAFLLPSLARMTNALPKEGKGPRILVLVPTRELAIQVAQAATKYSKYLKKVKTVCIYGGASFPLQIKDLSRYHEVLVATPGRLIDHLEEGRVDFSRVETLVLDEADRMLDIGFIDAVEKIAENLPAERQTLLFSATLKAENLSSFRSLLGESIQIDIKPEKFDAANIEQFFHFTKNIEEKYRLLNEILQRGSEVYQAIIFTATKAQADELAEQLSDTGELVDVLHGDLRQRQRTQTINRLRQGKIRVLVATDVASRGIDIPALSHVINFDLPRTIEDFEHRIGRTGRAGAKGVAISFISKRDFKIIKELEKQQKKTLIPSNAEFAADPSKKKKKRPSQKSNRDTERSFTTKQKSDKSAFRDSERPFASKHTARNRPSRESESSFGSKEKSSKSRYRGSEASFSSHRKPSKDGFRDSETPFAKKKTFPKSASKSSSKERFDRESYAKPHKKRRK